MERSRAERLRSVCGSADSPTQLDVGFGESRAGSATLVHLM